MPKKPDHSESALAADYLVQELAAVGEVVAKKMFGGQGIFADGLMFGLVTREGEIYFKTDASNQDRFDEAGSDKFGNMPYYALPEDVRENVDQLAEWARASMAVAQAAKEKK